MTFKEIIEEQKKPLDYKIEQAVSAFESGFNASAHKCGLAFSGGKDSTVLWDIVRRFLPEKSVEVIFGNTGVEFPESLKFAIELGREWGGEHFHEAKPEKLEKDGLKYQAQREVLEWLEREDRISEVLKADGKLKSTDCLEKKCPAWMLEDFRQRGLVWKAGTRKSYLWCADQYGYPILGKALSGKLTAHRINIDCFLKYSKSASSDPELIEYYRILKEVKTSNHCCSVLKKEPSEKMQAELGVDVIFKGLMAAESHMRMLNFATRGYLFKSSRPHCGDFYHCQPLAIWTDDDIWEYIHRFDVLYSTLYDIEYEDADGDICRIKRNGCVGCATDIAFKNNHMSALRKTHPKLWENYMVKTGMGSELLKLHKLKGSKLSKMDFFDNAGNLASVSPCAFDDPQISMDELTSSEYDAEEIL